MATGGRDAGFAVRAISGVSDRRRHDPARSWLARLRASSSSAPVLRDHVKRKTVSKAQPAKTCSIRCDIGFRRCLVDVRRVGLFYRAEYEPRLLEELHLLERGMQRIRRRGNRIDRGVTGFLGCDPRFLGGASDLLLCLPEPLELVPIPVAGLPRFLRQYPEPLGLSPGSLGDHAMFFGDVAVRLGLLTAIFSTPGPALGLPALLFYRQVIVSHFGLTPERRVFIRQEVCPTATKLASPLWTHRCIVKRLPGARSKARLITGCLRSTVHPSRRRPRPRSGGFKGVWPWNRSKSERSTFRRFSTPGAPRERSWSIAEAR